MFIALLSACSRPEFGYGTLDEAPASAENQAVLTAHPDTLDSQAISQSQQAHLQDRQFVVHANVNFATDDVVKTKDSLETLTLQAGGYIQKTHLYNSTISEDTYPIGGEKLKVLTHFIRRGEMVVRIPKDNVGEFLKNVQAHVVFLDAHEFNASDVALDLQRQALLAQIEAQKQQQLDSLTTNQTDGLSDKSTHISELSQSKHSQALAELEQKSIAEQVAFSTISLNFYQDPKLFEKVIPDSKAHINKERHNHFWHEFSQSLSQGWQYFLMFLLWLTRLWVFMLAIPMVVIFYKKVIKRWWHKPSLPKPQENPQDDKELG